MKNKETQAESRIEKFIKATLPKAGEILRKKFRKARVKYAKSHALDVVTEADLAANDLLVGAIKRAFPDHGIISEETGEYRIGSKYLWVIDPLDGTFNYLHGVPILATMLAVFEDGEIIMSAIYEPMRKEMFFAKKGSGATFNGKRIKALPKSGIKSSVGGVSSSFRKEQMEFCNMLKARSKRTTLMTVGSAGYNVICTALGARDWYVNYNPKVWDISPAVLLLAEAGYTVTNIQGKSWKFGDQGIIAAEKTLHKQLVEMVRRSFE